MTLTFRDHLPLYTEYEILKANGVISDAGGEKEAFERIKMRLECIVYIVCIMCPSAIKFAI